jgi:hypothetical protein
MEARRLELAADVCEHGRRARRRGHAGTVQKAIDVEHPEADAFDVKGPDRTRQGLAFLDDWLKLVSPCMRAQDRDQSIDLRFRAQTVIGGHPSSRLFACEPSVNSL